MSDIGIMSWSCGIRVESLVVRETVAFGF